MSIKTKLFLNFSIIILILLGVSTYSVYEMSKLNDDYSYLIDDRAHKVIEVGKVQNAVSLQGLYMRSYVLRQDPSDLESLSEQQEIIQTTIEQIEPLFTLEQMKKHIQTIKEQQILYNSYVDKVVEYIDNNEKEQANTMLFNYALPTNKKIQVAIESIVDFQAEQMAKTKKAATSSAAYSKKILIVISIITTIISILLAIFIIRNITVPLKRVTDAAKVMATGDLSGKDIVVNTKDELKDLANAFNTMKNNLSNLIRTIIANVSNTTASAEQLASSIDEITHASQDVAKSAEVLVIGGSNAAKTGKECAAATDETAQAIGRIAEAAQELNSQAVNTQSLAEEGGIILQTTEEQMLVIQKFSHETKEKIKQLSDQSTEIENITKVITDITEQTNLLALNAAIEAARAGEHGKGFAVVADEVRKLAEESKISANKIAGLTSLIQKETKEVEESVTITVQNVDQGVTYLKQAQSSFDRILNSINEMTSQIQEVSASTEEISASTEEVTASVGEMANLASQASEQSNNVLALVQEQTATMNEINSVAKSLNEEAVKIQEEVKQFKIN